VSQRTHRVEGDARARLENGFPGCITGVGLQQPRAIRLEHGDADNKALLVAFPVVMCSKHTRLLAQVLHEHIRGPEIRDVFLLTKYVLEVVPVDRHRLLQVLGGQLVAARPADHQEQLANSVDGHKATAKSRYGTAGCGRWRDELAVLGNLQAIQGRIESPRPNIRYDRGLGVLQKRKHQSYRREQGKYGQTQRRAPLKHDRNRCQHPTPDELGVEHPVGDGGVNM